MTSTPGKVNNSVLPEGRRTRIRYPVSALAYLDIGDDNGGIVLNLSEEGLGLQAVAPLQGQNEIRLRIQLPHLETRIETMAQIVWLGATNRQAGVRFLNLPAVARNQIREWIKSQPAPGLPTEDQAALVAPERPGTLAADAPHFGADVHSQTAPPCTTTPPDDPRTHKWLSLMEEFEADMGTQERTNAKPVLASERPTVPAAVLPHSRPEIVSRRFGVRVQGTESDFAPGASDVPQKTADRPVAISTTTSTTENAQPTARVSSEYGLPRAVDPRAVSASPPVSSPEVASVSRAKRARNQAVAVAAFALFSILCFGIGTRVGHFRSRQVPSPSVPSALETSAEASAPKHAKGQNDGTSEARSLRRLTKQTAGAKTHAAASQGAVGAKTDLARGTPPMHGTNGPGSISPPLSSQGAALVPSAETRMDSSNPRVVDGYVLQPSDRFNPCHLTYRVEPVYPTAAQQQRIEGTVKIHVVIAADGSVQNERVVSGPPALTSAAMDAAKYWRFFPALLNGQPIPVEKDLEVTFRLPR